MTNMRYDVSVIVPVHNAEKTLSRTVDSLLCQKEVSLEIILVENGSYDNSYELCEKIQAECDNVIVIKDEALGVSHARNEGIKRASAEYIGFVDADDYVDPDMYFKMRKIINDYDLAICEYYIENGNNTKRTDQLNRYSSEPIELMQRFVGRLNENEIPIMASVWRCLYRKDIIKNNGLLFDETLSIGEDALFNLNYLQHANKYVSIKDSLYHYSVSYSSTSLAVTEDLWQKYFAYCKAVKCFVYQYTNCKGIINGLRSRSCNLIHGLSSWIAYEYAMSEYSYAKKRRLINQIIIDRELLLNEDKVTVECKNVDKWLKERKYGLIISFGAIKSLKRKVKCTIMRFLKRN